MPAWLVAVLNDVTMFGIESYDVSSMSVAVRGSLLVSARHTPLRSVDRLRAHVKSGETFDTALGLLPSIGDLNLDGIEITCLLYTSDAADE